jgi:NitT/TauT family transport system permease protein
MNTDIRVQERAEDSISASERGEETRAKWGILQSYWILVPASFVFVAVLWEAVRLVFQVPEYVLPSVGAVGAGIIEHRVLLFEHVQITLKSVLTGFVLAVGLGFPIAMAIAFSRVIDRLLYPLLVAGQAIPKIALAPIIIMWFGFGFQAHVAIAVTIAIFPVVINSALGLKSIDPDLVRLARSIGASPLGMLWKIRLPNALPNVFAGLKLGMTFAVIGAVVGEFIAGGGGLGYLVQLGTGQLRTVLAFASIVVLSALGVALFYAVEAVERLTIGWHPTSTEIVGTT